RGGGCEETRAQPAVDRLALLVALDEVGIAVGLHVSGDTIERLVPADALPLTGAGIAHLGVLQAVGAVDEVQQAGALRAEGAAVDRVVGVALNVNDVLLDVLRGIALAVEDQAAADRAVRAGIARF